MDFVAVFLAIIALAAATRRSKFESEVDRILDDLSARVQYLEMRLTGVASAGLPRASSVAVAADDELASPSVPQPQREPIPDISAEPAFARRDSADDDLREAISPALSLQIEAESEPESDAELPWRERIDFEELFGRRLPVWGGSIALALAGFFLIKYSIDSGLMTPTVRTVLGIVFGFALIGSAEAARHVERFAIDPRIQQALSGAGIAVLYGAAYMASSLYGLVPLHVGFAMMAATTAAALGLSFRYGAPTALVGLIGGFATPALVSSGEGNVPALLGYLVLTIAGLLGVARQQGWRWLALLALAGGFGWSALLLSFGSLTGFDVPGTGLFLVVVALGAFLALPARSDSAQQRRLDIALPLASVVMASVQLAVLIGKGGFGWLEWGLYALLSVGATVVAARDNRFVAMPLAAFVVALVTFALWPAPPARDFALVGTGLAVVFFAPALSFALLKRHWLPWLITASSGPVLLFAVANIRLGDAASDTMWAAVALCLALPGAIGLWRTLGHEAHPRDWRLASFAASAATQVFVAAAIGLPALWLPTSVAIIMSALAYIQRRTMRVGTPVVTAASGIVALMTLAADSTRFLHSIDRAFGVDATLDPAAGLVMFAFPALLALVAGFCQQQHSVRRFYTAGSALLLVVALAQCVPLEWRAAVTAMLGLAALEAAGRFGQLPLHWPALGILAVSGIWTLSPLLQVAIEASGTLVGIKTDVSDLPTVRVTLLWLALPAAIAGAASWRQRLATQIGRWIATGAAIAGTGALYALYKHGFDIGGGRTFLHWGFAERTLLTQLFFAAGALAYWRGQRLAARALTVAACARIVWFDFVVFNPLWREQAVGPWPIFNLLLPAYGAALYWLWNGARRDELAPKVRLGVKGIALALGIHLIATSIRQAFVGSVFASAPISDAESYSYSLAGLVFAVVLLVAGTRRADQPMRIASLGIMLATVGKAFLLDAAALEGLWRIASFLGLGISLIGVSWYYTRYVFALGWTKSGTVTSSA